MYSYDYIPTYNEYLYYQQQQQQYQQPTSYYNQYQPQQQQYQSINNVKSAVWSSALYLPCLYPYLYEPFDYFHQQPQQQQQIVTTELNELYEYLIKEDNVQQQQPNAIRRLNFDNNSSSDTNEYINYIKKTTNTFDSTSLSSDDGYQSGSFDNFVENFNKIQYDNLAAVVANAKTPNKSIKTTTDH